MPFVNQLTLFSFLFDNFVVACIHNLGFGNGCKSRSKTYDIFKAVSKNTIFFCQHVKLVLPNQSNFTKFWFISLNAAKFVSVAIDKHLKIVEELLGGKE